MYNRRQNWEWRVMATREQTESDVSNVFKRQESHASGIR